MTKSRIQQAHSVENVKKSLPNIIKLILAFLLGLIIDGHTGTIDPSIILKAWEQYSAEIIGIVGFLGLQDLYRKR